MPDGASSRYWCANEKTRLPGARGTVELALPSPQFTITVCVSAVPGSVKAPEMVTLPFSSIAAEDRVAAVITGATFVTLIVRESVPVAPLASVTVSDTR